jgi:hypothetical protein
MGANKMTSPLYVNAVLSRSTAYEHIQMLNDALVSDGVGHISTHLRQSIEALAQFAEQLHRVSRFGESVTDKEQIKIFVDLVKKLV